MILGLQGKAQLLVSDQRWLRVEAIVILHLGDWIWMLSRTGSWNRHRTRGLPGRDVLCALNGSQSLLFISSSGRFGDEERPVWTTQKTVFCFLGGHGWNGMGWQPLSGLNASSAPSALPREPGFWRSRMIRAGVARCGAALQAALVYFWGYIRQGWDDSRWLLAIFSLFFKYVFRLEVTE
jgi:hypothetical protein